MAPTISIIVPVFNTLPYLDQCFSSLVGQTYSSIEIIAVDNGSTDGSLEWLESFAARRENVRVILHPDGRQGDARNAGIKEAKGEYIGFVDSDDYVADEMFEKLYAIALRSKADVITCNARRFTTTGGLGEAHINRASNLWPSNVFTILECPTLIRNSTVWNRLFRSEFLKHEELAFPGGVFHEDQFFTTTALLKARSLAATPECLYFYRQQREGSVNYLSNERHLEFFKVMDLTRKRFSELSPQGGVQPLLDELFIEKGLMVYSLTRGDSKRLFYEQMRTAFRQLTLGEDMRILSPGERRVFFFVCKCRRWQFSVFLRLRRIYAWIRGLTVRRES